MDKKKLDIAVHCKTLTTDCLHCNRDELECADIDKFILQELTKIKKGEYVDEDYMQLMLKKQKEKFQNTFLPEDIFGEVNVIKEIIIWAIYEEMHPIPTPDNSTASEINNRKQKAINEYLGQRVGATINKLPILFHKVNKIMALIRQAMFKKIEINNENDSK